MLKSVGGGSGALNIDPPTSGTVNATLEGVDSTVATVDWTLFEGLVTLTFKGVTFGASNSTELSVPAGTFPAQLRPLHATIVSCSLISGSVRTGRVTVPAAGAGGSGGLFFDFPNDVGNLGPLNFSDSGVKGVPLGLQIVYHL